MYVWCISMLPSVLKHGAPLILHLRTANMLNLHVKGINLSLPKKVNKILKEDKALKEQINSHLSESGLELAFNELKVNTSKLVNKSVKVQK
jgi:hypothetical protein